MKLLHHELVVSEVPSCWCWRWTPGPRAPAACRSMRCWWPSRVCPPSEPTPACRPVSEPWWFLGHFLGDGPQCRWPLWETPEGQITFHVTKLTLNVVWMITLLKMKSLYCHLWFCEEKLTLIEHFHWLKGSYVISFLPWDKKKITVPFYSQFWLF